LRGHDKAEKGCDTDETGGAKPEGKASESGETFRVAPLFRLGVVQNYLSFVRREHLASQA
jgi:hypothetical protein